MKSVSTYIEKLRSSHIASRLMGPGLFALVIKVLSAGLSYFMQVAYARMLSNENYGYFGVMLNISIVLAAVAGLGLPVAALRFWAGQMARGQKDLAKGFTIGAQKLLGLVCVVLLGGGLIATWFGWGQSYVGSPYGILLVCILAGAFAYGDYYASVLRAQERLFWSLLPRDVFWRFVAPMLAFFILQGAGGLTAVQAIGTCVLVMVAVALLQAAIGFRTTQQLAGPVAARSEWKAWTKILVPLAGASIVFAMIQQLDVVVVGGLVGAKEAGAYFAAQKTASLLGLVMVAGGMVAAPLMAAAYGGGRTAELQRICTILAIAIAGTTLIGFLVLAVLGRWLLAIFDPGFAASYPVLLVLAVGYSIDAMAGPTAYLMQMTTLEGAYLRIMAIVYAFVLALQLVFVPLYGPIAAAAATASGVCLWNIISIRLLRQKIGVDSSILSVFLPPKAV